jgi:tyrosine decarboxylase/aspartate 1-decarboxylase
MAAMLMDPVPDLLSRSTELLEAEFAALPAFEPNVDTAAIAQVLKDVAHRLGDNYPYFHPLYAGQMLKPPHPVARAAYALAMNLNPNNHARDGGRASSEMEIEAVAAIARMFGWTEFLGHLTSSGTLANLEALWVAGQLAPGRRIVGSEQAHYTHRRISSVLKLEFTGIEADSRGRMNLDALEAELRKGDVGTVVATLGTTALGAVDPLDSIMALRERYGFRLHVDAAYGGYFRLIPEALDEPARRAFEAIDQADSIVVDPHKHGLQPYGCGCVLFRDPAVGRFYKHDSPYTYFTSKQLHLAAVEHDRRLREDLTGRFQPLAAGRPELDIVVWKLTAATLQRASELAHRVFEACAAKELHLALVELPVAWFRQEAASEPKDCTADDVQLVTCLRSVLMKPEHEAWLDRIWERLTASCAAVMGE